MATDYCTAADLNDYLSQVGVDHFADHDDDRLDPDNVIADCIEQATDEVNLYVLTGGRYDIADLVGNRLLKNWCTVLACCHLCHRRGNPVPMSLAESCDKVMEKLQAVKDKKLSLPEVARQGLGVPTFSNLTIDRRFRRERIRTTRDNSTPISTSQEQDTSIEISE